jgi:phosphoribosyl-ATP pyrophosphohydrolase
MSPDTLERLASSIHARRHAAADKSYTRQLLDAGPARCAKKFGEEAVETVIAAVHQDDAALKAEAADLLYHLLVVLEVRNLALADVLGVLEARMAQSGLEEKAARTS